MKNNFKENLNKKIVNDICKDTILGLQQQLCAEARVNVGDIYDAFKALEKSRGLNHLFKSTKQSTASKVSYDYGLALNIFLQKFLMENKNEIEQMRQCYIETQRNELGIRQTANPNYYISKDNCYYTFDYDKFIKQEHIIDVADDGCYTTKSSIANSEYSVIRVFQPNDSIKYLQMVDKNNRKVSNFKEIIRYLKLKKEVAKRIKRIGYCGKSFDTCADVLNLFYKPIETGYYSDENYNFYRWDYKNSQFVRNIREGSTPGAPNISDYEFMDSKTIVRTDYNGAGFGLQFS